MTKNRERKTASSDADQAREHSATVPLPNVYLFYGEDGLALRRKLAAWLTRFALKSDMDLDKEVLDENASIGHIQSALSLLPLLGPKRLVIIHDACVRPVAEQQKLIVSLGLLHQEVVAVFVEQGIPAKSGALYAYLQTAATFEYFAAPTPLAIRRIIQHELKAVDKTITADALALLIERAGSDQYGLMNHLNALSLADGTVVTADLIKLYVPLPLESRIFAFSDAVFTGSAAKAARHLQTELNFGTAPLQLLGMLLTQTRRLMLAREAIATGSQTIPGLATLKPYAQSQLRKAAQNLSNDRLIAYYIKLCEADVLLKSGGDETAVLLHLLSC